MEAVLLILLISVTIYFFFRKKQWYKPIHSVIFTAVFLVIVILIRFFSDWVVSTGYGYSSLAIGNGTKLYISEVGNYIEKGADQIFVGENVYIDFFSEIIYFKEDTEVVGVTYSTQSFTEVFVFGGDAINLFPIKKYFKLKLLYYNSLAVVIFCILHAGWLIHTYRKRVIKFTEPMLDIENQ